MIIEELRKQTRSHHDRIELGLDLMSPALDAEKYLAILRKLEALHLPLEARIQARAEFPVVMEFCLPLRKKAHRLRLDRQALGDISDIVPHRAPVLPALGTLGGVLGALYVVEGSTLGGQVIARRLRERLGIDAHSGAGFFSGYAERTGTMWKELVAFLAAQVPEREELRAEFIAEVVRGAIDTFTAFERAMRAEIPLLPESFTVAAPV